VDAGGLKPGGFVPEDKEGVQVLHLVKPISRQFGLVCSVGAEPFQPAHRKTAPKPKSGLGAVRFDA
jgi:hypothetical protein